MNEVDVYWSFRSPYSYLATPDMLKLCDDFEATVNLRPVLPIAIRTPDVLFNQANLNKVRYIQLDWARRARFLGMSDQWPSPDPIVQNLETMEIASAQPFIYRLSFLGVEAQRQGRGIEFAYEVSHLLFGGTKTWHKGTHLAEATTRAGLDLEQMDAEIENGTHLSEIETNQQQLDASGHWGVPTLEHQGEPFFGQDRIETLRWHLSNLGLSRS